MEQPERQEDIRIYFCLFKDNTFLLVESEIFFYSQAFDIKN